MLNNVDGASEVVRRALQRAQCHRSPPGGVQQCRGSQIKYVKAIDINSR